MWYNLRIAEDITGITDPSPASGGEEGDDPELTAPSGTIASFQVNDQQLAQIVNGFMAKKDSAPLPVTTSDGRKVLIIHGALMPDGKVDFYGGPGPDGQGLYLTPEEVQQQYPGYQILGCYANRAQGVKSFAPNSGVANLVVPEGPNPSGQVFVTQ